MSVRPSLPWLLAVGMVAAACGGTPADDAEHLEPSPVAEGLDVIVVPDQNGAYPLDLIATCPSGRPSFPISALDDIAVINADDPDGMLAALEPFLDSEEGVFWPQDGWQLLHRGAQEAILVTPFGGSVAFMFLDHEADGWVLSGSSSHGRPCELQNAIPANLNTVEWRLDPSAPAPGPDATELHVLLTERECVSGQEIGARLVGLQLVITHTDVRMAFAAEPPPGDAFTCQGSPETPYTVQLTEPLGEREIKEAMSIGLRLEDYLR